MTDRLEPKPHVASAVRSQLVQRLQVAAMGWSLDGHIVEFAAGFDVGIEPGGFATVTLSSGDRVLVHVHQVRTTTRSIDVEVSADEFGFADVVRAATTAVTARHVEGSGVVLGGLDGAAAPTAAFGESPIARADADDVASWFHGDAASATTLEIGRLADVDEPARLRAKGLARHTFMCGQSGSGKTFSLGVLLERVLLETDLPMVVIDPNSDYVNLGSIADAETINRFRATPLTTAEYDALAARYRSRADVVVASARDHDLPLRFHFSDLTIEEQALTLQLDPLGDPDQYRALVRAVDSIGDRAYSVADVVEELGRRPDDANARLAGRIANLGVSAWSVWASADEPSLTATGIGHRALVLDTGSLDDPRERSVVSLALLGRLRRRPQRSPVSIVIDEAHNVCSPDAATAVERAVADLAVWIAAEGRKFGLYLLLSSQRPQKLHENVLSQCDNLLLMRVNSRSDLAELTRVFSHVPSPLIERATSHRMGELLAAGPIAPTPLRLQVAERWTIEGGADLPLDWLTPSD